MIESNILNIFPEIVDKKRRKKEEKRRKKKKEEEIQDGQKIQGPGV